MGGTCSVCQNSYKFDPIIDNNIIETTNSHKQNSDSLKHSSPILNVNTLDPLFANNTPNQKTLKLIPMDLGFSRNFFESDYQNYINLQKKSLLMYIINSQTLNINELVYEGQINENNERHGKGVLKWPNGTIYIGDWFLNKANGRGIISFPKFEHYEGLFINNTFEGEGVYFNCQGTRFEGLWSNNYPEGLGIETYSDGSKYEGNYSRGKKNGKGFIMFADGGYYEGLNFIIFFHLLNFRGIQSE